MKAFNLTKGVGAVIDAMVNVTIDAMKEAVSSYGGRNRCRERARLLHVGNVRALSTAQNVSLSFLRPRFPGSCKLHVHRRKRWKNGGKVEDS